MPAFNLPVFLRFFLFSFLVACFFPLSVDNFEAKAAMPSESTQQMTTSEAGDSRPHNEDTNTKESKEDVAETDAGSVIDEASARDSQKEEVLETVVISTVMPDAPLRIETDPRAPRQPVPAQDGGGYLKNITGFSVVRKGGSGSDPILRGLGGSRLNILMDGGALQGGCGGRMDPPTAYTFPESYDSITVLKGPQSVRYGKSLAGTVLFERKTKRFEKPGVRLNTSIFGGSYNRNDELMDVTAGGPVGFARFIGTFSESDDYKDGDGNKVRSSYRRKSGTGIIGLTPDDDTRLELSTDISRGKADYADRAMDGSKFDRETYQLKFEKKNISDFVREVNLNLFYNHIDHVMDNFSRKGQVMYMANNPDRETVGGTVSTTMALSESTETVIGYDFQRNEHRNRMYRGKKKQRDYSTGRIKDMRFATHGLFLELTQHLGLSDRLLAGLRGDFMDVKHKQQDKTDTEESYSWFLRYEHDFESLPSTLYLALGHVERPADWWERNKDFNLKQEKSTQVDVGFIYKAENFEINPSLFYSSIDDYILITSSAPGARNINAETFGGEIDAAFNFAKYWKATGSLSYVQGKNKSDGKALAQMPPLEGTVGLSFVHEKFEIGSQLRMVAKQTRVDKGSGSIMGTDIGPSAGFAILSLNAAVKPFEDFKLAAGVDNIFDTTYAEHLSKSVPAALAGQGYEQTTRVNEPGRNFWLKASYVF